MTPLIEDEGASHSIDTLIAAQLPAWAKNASVEALRSLRAALISEQHSAEQVRLLLGRVPDLADFCAPLLEKAILRKHGVRVNARTAKLSTVVRKTVAFVFPHVPVERVVRMGSLPLLAAALHNFAEDELQHRSRIRRRLETHTGAALPISFVQFARLCRELDLGGRYQAALRELLLPADAEGDSSGQARQAVERVLEEAQRTAMEAAVRLATLQGQLDERSYLQMLRVFSPKAIVPADTRVLVMRQLLLLGKRVRGVVVVEARDSDGGALRNLIVWVPGDPVRAVQSCRNWEAVYQLFGLRLRESSYAQFFMRFITERDRMVFSASLRRLHADTAKGVALQLDGRNLPIDQPIFAYLRAQRIEKILDDARVLAVPTGDEDAATRSARLAAYESTGLTLLGLAGLFVPVLGEVMLGVAAVQMADEVYEGYQDWKLGDREAAMGHLFAVAENLVVGAAIGVGVSAAAQVVKRVAFVDELVPVWSGAKRLKLCSGDMQPYRVEAKQAHLAGQPPEPLPWPEHAFELAHAEDKQGLVIKHPTRASAYRPQIERNGSWGWRHSLEQPQEWAGEVYLLRRLAANFIDLSDEQARALIDCTGFDEAQLRRLHVENAPAPARLQDALERHRLHTLYPKVADEVFELLIAQAQDAEEVEDRVLRRDFPGLSVRGAKEIRRQADGQDLEQLASTGRVPLAVAERVRWFIRDSRLDRACAGLRQPQALNADSEKLALGLVHELAPWPASLRVELRAFFSEGPLLSHVGADTAEDVISIISDENGYSVQDRSLHPHVAGSSTDSFMHALLLSMDESQKSVLGDASLNEQQLVDILAGCARERRDLAAKLIGLADISAGVRPPVRFADGRLGYPLSGRGESRGQASRRGIRQIFPTIDDVELQQYLLGLISDGVDPWTHYQSLHGQWTALRQALINWRAEYGSMLDLLRRSRVANTIRRCWRRKLGRRGDGTYALEVRGERLSELPELPLGIMFEHVSRLALRNMELTEVGADFLGHFPNLRELDLRHNRLLAVPAGIERLTELRLLRLDHNHIVLTPADSQRLNALLNLERLEIGFNPLGSVPEVRRLLNVRQVGLRAAQIADVPAQIQQLPWQGIVDLRENQIRQVRQEVHGVRMRVQQMALHDNPLDAPSERYLNELRTPASPEQVVAHNPYYRHHLVRQAELSEWLVGSAGAQRTEREVLWSNLRNEPGADDFFNFLGDFSRSPDYLKHPAYYRARAWNIIEACEQDSELREVLFEQAGGVATCEDRLLWLFSEMEVRVLVHRQTAGLSQIQSESALIKLGRSLFRLQEVNRIAARKLERLRLTYANEPDVLERIDDIETYLAYRTRLAGPLQLPGQPVRMHYESESLVTAEDINVARAEVLSLENNETLSRALADQSFWQEFLRATYYRSFREQVDARRAALELLETQVESGAIDEQTYLERCEELKVDLQVQERVLVQRLTEQAIARWPV
ncbi:NEL-type E3 ubiquitin ligase domain-containing protein [Pseudomonas sp. AP-1]|uniref:NEL-type E3 ubiquitin ligase domain-containing protein n=1 Tax=Pseudomonas sp. AP-1 TaxID=3231718 RepID=UPI0035AF5B75